MLQKKQKLFMATPTVARECTLGSHRNSRKTIKLPPRWEMWPDSPVLRAEQCLFPTKQVRSLDFLDGTTESPPEVPHKSRRTLM